MSYEQTEVTDVKVSDLSPYQNRFKIIFKVAEKGEEREVSNRNNPDETHRLSDITVGDDTGSIILTAWDDDIDLLQEEKCFALVNGFINVFQDSMRLSRGKFGNFEEINDSEITIDLSNNRSEEVHERRSRRRDNYDGDRGGRQSNYNRNSNQRF